MVAILFFSVFLLSPDSEFVEASPAPYNPEELGKSAPSPAFSNSAGKARVWGPPRRHQEEERSHGSLPGLHVRSEARTGLFPARALWAGWPRKGQLCGGTTAGARGQVNGSARGSAAPQTSQPGASACLKDAAVGGSAQPGALHEEDSLSLTRTKAT